MLGAHLITKQTTHRGNLCERVMVCKRLFTRREYYFSITLDRKHAVCFTGFIRIVPLF
uniref:ATP-grasp_2 domain-containing protein n=1 Tax=Ascaris lumbricoides TaxID=6252 RepID=A0A0M3HKY8_ASCLU